MTKHILFTSIFLSSLSLFGANVPEFRGEGRTGIYNESGLAKSWGDSPKLLWKANLGEGYLPPSVVDGKLYLNALDASGKNEMLKVLDKNGKLLWEVKYSKARSGSYNSARTMPTIVGDSAYLISDIGVLACVDLKAKKLAWSVDVVKDYDGKSLPWGYGENPLVVDGKVIFTVGGDKTAVVAFDAKTGKLAWKTKSFKVISSYTTPIKIEHNGKTQIVASVASYIFGIDPANGDILWEARPERQAEEKPNKPNAKKKPSKRPPDEYSSFWKVAGGAPVYKDGKLFFTAGYNVGSVLLELPEGKGEVKTLWKNADFDNHHGGVVLLNGRLYGANWDSNQMGNWMCVDWETGKTIYDDEWKAFSKGSIVSADDMLYVYEEKKGEVALVNPNSDKFDVVSSFAITEGKGPHWAHIVIADKVMYVKRGEVLMAFDIKE